MRDPVCTHTCSRLWFRITVASMSSCRATITPGSAAPSSLKQGVQPALLSARTMPGPAAATQLPASKAKQTPSVPTGNLLGRILPAKRQVSASAMAGAKRFSFTSKPTPGATQSRPPVSVKHASTAKAVVPGHTASLLQLNPSSPKANTSVQGITKSRSSLLVANSLAPKQSQNRLVAFATSRGVQQPRATPASSPRPALSFSFGAAQNNSKAAPVQHDPVSHSQTSAKHTADVELHPSLQATAVKHTPPPELQAHDINIHQDSAAPCGQGSPRITHTPSSAPAADPVMTQTPLAAASPATPHTNKGLAAQQTREKLAEPEHTPSHTSISNDKAEKPASQQRPLWTATSLAGDMMHNVKHLESVCIAQQLQT